MGASNIIMEGDLIFLKSGLLKTFERILQSVNHRKGGTKERFFATDQKKNVEMADNILSIS